MQHPADTPATRFHPLQRAPLAPPFLRTDPEAALRSHFTLVQAQAHLIQALDELQMVTIEEENVQQAAHFHEAFVQILHTAQTLHHTVEDTVLEQMAHALQVHYTHHDRVAHALVSAWTCVGPRDPVGLVIELVDRLASDAAPLPFWLSHLLQLLPLSGPQRELSDAQRQARALLQPRLDELTPARLTKSLQRLESDPSPHGLQQLVGDLGLLALEQSPTADLSRFVETPPADDPSLVWFSHQHPGLVCVGDMPCDDHWLLTPLGHATLDRLLHTCSRLAPEPARRLTHQLLYQYTHAARLPLLRPGRRHPALALAPLHRIAQALQAAGDADPWVDVLQWLAPHRTGHRGHPSENASARHTLVDLLLLPSFEFNPVLALRTVLDARVDPGVWLPCVVRHCMATQPGLSRLLRPLMHLQASSHLHQQLAQEVLAQCPPAHRMRVGFEMALTAFNGPVSHQGLTREGLHALARTQARFGAGWVPFSLLTHLMGEARRFGVGGLGAAEGDWLLAFARENVHHLPPGMPAPAMEDALHNLFDVLTRLGLEPDGVAQACLHLFDQCMLTPMTASTTASA